MSVNPREGMKVRSERHSLDQRFVVSHLFDFPFGYLNLRFLVLVAQLSRNFEHAIRVQGIDGWDEISYFFDVLEFLRRERRTLSFYFLPCDASYKRLPTL